jgi:hypothetical protein
LYFVDKKVVGVFVRFRAASTASNIIIIAKIKANNATIQIPRFSSSGNELLKLIKSIHTFRLFNII